MISRTPAKSSTTTTTGSFNTTSATYQTALSKTGSGRLKELRAWTSNSSYASSVKVTIDGVVIIDGFNSTSLSQWSNSYVSPLYNSTYNIKGFGIFDLSYKTSLLIESKSNGAGIRVDCTWTIEEG